MAAEHVGKPNTAVSQDQVCNQTWLTTPKQEAYKMRSNSPFMCEMHSGWADLRWLQCGQSGVDGPHGQD